MKIAAKGRGISRSRSIEKVGKAVIFVVEQGHSNFLANLYSEGIEGGRIVSIESM